MRLIGSVFAILAALLAAAPVWAVEGKLIHVVRFTDYEFGPVEDWLRGKGFQFKEDARRRDRIDFDVGENGFAVEAKRRAFGFMPNESVNVPEFTYVEIDWGVNKFPEGASYEQGVRNEAIMIYIFMGDERQPSGSFFIPDSPYFIALFLCHASRGSPRPGTSKPSRSGGCQPSPTRTCAPSGAKAPPSRPRRAPSHRSRSVRGVCRRLRPRATPACRRAVRSHGRRPRG